MKTLLLLAMCVLVLSCSPSGDKKNSNTSKAEITKAEFAMSGMTCNGCEQTVEACVMKVKGVQEVKADHETQQTLVLFDASVTDTSTIATAIKELKEYPVLNITMAKADSINM
ncbi:MAG: cation transporter [Bacteroidales bacterium]|nr:cation transporter [Bacteroidales bacterium]